MTSCRLRPRNNSYCLNSKIILAGKPAAKARENRIFAARPCDRSDERFPKELRNARAGAKNCRPFAAKHKARCIGQMASRLARRRELHW